MPCNDGQEMLQPRAGADDVAVAVGRVLPDRPHVRLTQRVRPPRSARRVPWVLLVVLAGHALVAGLMARSPRPRAANAPAIAVTLVEPAPAVPPPPAPVLPPAPLRAPRLPALPVHPIPRAPGSMAATLEDEQGRPLKLYGPRGQVLLPGGSPAPPPAYRAPTPQGAPVLTIKTPVKYKPTGFGKDFAPTNRSEGSKLFDRIVEGTTATKTVHLPAGTAVQCVVSPLVLAFGCHGKIPPAPKNDDDIRLSLPPPRTLTGARVVPASAATAPRPASSADP